MSGSLTWRTYTSDAGLNYLLFRDESNADSTVSGGTGKLLGAFVAGAQGLPNLVKPRYVNAQSTTNPLIRKKFLIGTIAQFGAIVAGAVITENTSPAQTWNVTGKVGEKIRIPTQADTGQNDGTPNS